MIKAKRSPRPRILELKKETLVVLGEDVLRDVIGGNLTTVKSQCPTLCF
ncbi:MAG TPA: hypothetical protein VFT22_13330 [Kofleriaceae bacterium]|nr:hypothetical protein [Kofleriaceae bacterium]